LQLQKALSFGESITPGATSISRSVNGDGYPIRSATPVFYREIGWDRGITDGRRAQSLLDSADKTKVPHGHRFYDDDNLARHHHPFLPGGRRRRLAVPIHDVAEDLPQALELILRPRSKFAKNLTLKLVRDS
jgi:hypothetical protein